MKNIYYDKKYHFVYFFDTETGEYMRSGILNDKGEDTNVDPFMASFPHLIDVGIMGHCIHGKTGLCAKAGVECYQSGLYVEKPNMSLEDFRSICEQCKNKVNQFALGGRGDPDQHENFKEILQMCQEYNIVPNFTTSGYGMTKEIAQLCKEYCGAVAVSQYSRLKDVYVKYENPTILDDLTTEPRYIGTYRNLKALLSDGWKVVDKPEEGCEHWCYESNNYTTDAINTLIDNGVKTNIHYVVGNQSIDELLMRFKLNAFPKGLNALILLLHKPAGMGSQKNVLSTSDERVKALYETIDGKFPFKIGMDSCNVPGAINFCKNIAMESLDTCEGARYSCYIGSDMKMVPCSFDQTGRFSCDLSTMSIKEAWNSEQFNAFRNIMKSSCPNCSKREQCLGGCPLMPKVVLCDNKH